MTIVSNVCFVGVECDLPFTGSTPVATDGDAELNENFVPVEMSSVSLYL